MNLYEYISVSMKEGTTRSIVNIYPALNPIGIDSITRGIPLFDLDMNRIFPGTQDGAVEEYIVQGSLRIHASATVLQSTLAHSLNRKGYPHW